jgi:hypothetical protein
MYAVHVPCTLYDMQKKKGNARPGDRCHAPLGTCLHIATLERTYSTLRYSRPCMDQSNTHLPKPLACRSEPWLNSIDLAETGELPAPTTWSNGYVTSFLTLQAILLGLSRPMIAVYKVHCIHPRLGPLVCRDFVLWLSSPNMYCTVHSLWNDHALH